MDSALTSHDTERRSASKAARMQRAALITDYRRPLEIGEIPVDSPRADGAVVRVEACGVCRSDWHFWNHDLNWVGFNLQLPAVLGGRSSYDPLSRI